MPLLSTEAESIRDGWVDLVFPAQPETAKRVTHASPATAHTDRAEETITAPPGYIRAMVSKTRGWTASVQAHSTKTISALQLFLSYLQKILTNGPHPVQTLKTAQSRPPRRHDRCCYDLHPGSSRKTWVESQRRTPPVPIQPE